MELQVYSISIEDRIPRALPPTAASHALTVDGFSEAVRGETVQKRVDGCVAFVWGRTADGESICVRVEGVRPRLFFKMDREGDTVASLKRELETEVSSLIFRDDRGGIEVVARDMSHFCGYEPDPTSASGRKVHTYGEALYPNLTSWRRAARLRKEQDLRALRDKLGAARRVLHDVTSRRDAARLVALKDRTHAPAYEALERAVEDETRHVALVKKHWDAQTEGWDEFCNEHGDEEEGEIPRPARLRMAQEWFVDPTTRFIQETGVRPSKWLRVPANGAPQRVTTCRYELVVDECDLSPVNDRDEDAPYTVLYYDLETTGLEPETHGIIQASMVFRQGEAKKKVLVCIGTHDAISGVTIVECHNEVELLLEFRRLVVQEDPDFVVAYNGVNFDNAFLNTRALLLEAKEFFYMSRYALKPSRLRDLKLQSSGMGDNLLRYFDLPGRSNFDWYVKLKRDLTQEDSYSLDYMAAKFCGQKKVELASGLKWKRLSDNYECDPAYELVGQDALADAVAGGQGLYTFSQDEWRALGVAQELCEHHWVRARGEEDGNEGEKKSARYRPANTKHRAIPDLYYGTSKDRARLGYYCVEDSDLLDKLDEARAMIVEILQFSGVFGIIAEWVYFRGQQVRFVSQILCEVRVAESVPLLMQRPPEGFSGEDHDGFQGAVVNEPKRGFHTKPVAVLDWKSLYPSIMMSHNLCHSTWVRDPALFEMEGVVRHEVTPDFVTYFVSSDVHRGILPRILERLMGERSRAKKMVKVHAKAAKEAKAAGDAAEVRRHTMLSKVWDGRQLAIKVSMNSIYGACGTSVDAGAKFPCLAISATVTYEGRVAMDVKKDILPKHFPGIDVVYGDSVAHYTPLLVRRALASSPLHEMRVVTPEELWDEAVSHAPHADASKEAALLPDGVWETWTETGWTPITTVIRHKCNKPMFRVTTHTGVVDVTEDHSLLREEDASMCRAQDLTVGETRLLHAWPEITAPECETDGNVVDLARIAGMFIGDGSCNVYKDHDYVWVINNADYDMLDRYRLLCEKTLGTLSSFRILDTMASSGVFKLVPLGSPKRIVTLFRDICYVREQKTVPGFVLNGNRDVMTAFLGGLYDADGAKRACDGSKGGGGHNSLTMSPLHSWQCGSVIDQKSERVSLGLFAILRFMGYNVSINTRCDKLQMYRIRFTLQHLRKPATTLKKLHPLPPTDAFVYDLTTHNHHFHAGVGQMIVHNTDSVMVTFADADDVQTCGALSAKAADVVTHHFKQVLKLGQMELEFEKVYYPYLLQGKKRYVGVKYEPDASGTMVAKGIDAKGVETERKDTLPYVKLIFYDVRDALMIRMDEQEALRVFKARMDALVDDKVPMEQLTLRKNLSSKVEHKTDSIVQARVNAKRREREPGSEASVNEQVEYVILNGCKKDKTTFLAEDPVYAREHGLKLNRLWCFEHCILKAMAKVFEVCKTVDYAAECAYYSKRLDAERLGVNRNAMLSMMSFGASSSSSSSSRPPPAPPRPILTKKEAKKRAKR